MEDLPSLLDFFKNELGFEVAADTSSLGYALYYVDLSSLKLRLSNRTPIIWVRKFDIERMSPYQLIQSFQDVIREQKWRNQIIIVLLDGNSEPLLKYTEGPLYSNLVIIGKEEQEGIRQSRRPTGDLVDIVSIQIPISLLSPYETTSPVTGNRFFGREYERNRILGNPETNHLVLGIRRIGKTSLLKEIERILRKQKENAPNIIYMDCSDLPSIDDYIREVVRRLDPRELPRLELQKYVFYFPNFLERMELRYKTKLVFILDEIDNLIISQRGDWELFRMLRASSNKGTCQYIIAGFREAQREQYLIDSPMFNFAPPIRLNEFTMQQARDLIVAPMEGLNIHFKNRDEVVTRIYDETAGHPNLIQYYCTILLRQLDLTGEREINPDSLIAIYKDEAFRGHLLSSFMENTSNREKAVVYAALLELKATSHLGIISQASIDGSLQKRGVVLTQTDIDEACNILILVGIFHRKEKDYSFTSPVFVKMLQRYYDMDYLLNKAKKEGI